MGMIVKRRDLEFLAVDVLVPYENNARTHSEDQVAQIAASIEKFGFTNPVLIDDENGIIAGHGRVEAAKVLGIDEVPCLRLAGMSEEDRRAYIIADNKLAENAGWDDDLLRLELGTLKEFGFDLSVVGFSTDELDELFIDAEELEEEGLTDPDEVPSASNKLVTRKGDVWICGDHRLVCGDSTDLSAVDALMGDELADMCWTDPPYNVNYQALAGSIANDNLGDSEFGEFLREAFTSTFVALAPGAAIYVAHADTEGLNFRSAFADSGFKLSGCLVWVKPSLVLGRSDYQWRHEPILYGWKPGHAHRWFGGRAQTTVIDCEDPPFVVSADGSVLIDAGGGTVRISGTDLRVEELKSTVVRHEKPAKNPDHPTMKPVGLIIEQMKNSSRRGDLVFDPFGGSGSTMIAAQKIGRSARLIELDEKYCDVIVRRWQDFTGNAAVLEETGQKFDALAKKRASKK